LFSAYCELSRRSGVNEGSHSFYLPPTRLSTTGMSHTCLYTQPQSVVALWLALVSRPSEGRRLSWPNVYVYLCLLAVAKKQLHRYMSGLWYLTVNLGRVQLASD